MLLQNTTPPLAAQRAATRQRDKAAIILLPDLGLEGVCCDLLHAKEARICRRRHVQLQHLVTSWLERRSSHRHATSGAGQPLCACWTKFSLPIEYALRLTFCCTLPIERALGNLQPFSDLHTPSAILKEWVPDLSLQSPRCSLHTVG